MRKFMSKKSSVVAAMLFALSGLACPSFGQSTAPVALQKTTQLPGVNGSFDHLAFDMARKRFLLAAEDNGTIEVFDLRNGLHLESLPGFGNPHNIVVRGGASTILVADSEASKSQLLDAKTYKNLKSLPLELGANCTLYDSQRKRIYITTGGDRVKLSTSTLIAVNADTGAVLKSTPMPSIHLQPLALDPSTGRLFVNLADKNIVAVVDRDSFKILAQWTTGAAKTNSAISFDAVHHRLFVVGEPGVMVVLNSDTGKITDTISVPASADDLAFDEIQHRLYVPGGDGYLGVYDSTDPDHVKEIARIATRKEARTAMLVPQEHKYILAAPAVDGKPAAVMIYATN